MPEYRKVPVVVQARQWDGTARGASLIIEWASWYGVTATYTCAGPCQGDEDEHWIEIRTLEGDMKVSKDDFIIKGVENEFYPCKPEIFAKTYEEVV